MKPQNTKLIVRIACLAIAGLMLLGLFASLIFSLL